MIAVAVTLVLVATSALLSLLGNLQQNYNIVQQKNEKLPTISQRIDYIGLWAYGLMLTQRKYMLLRLHPVHLADDLIRVTYF